MVNRNFHVVQFQCSNWLIAHCTKLQVLYNNYYPITLDISTDKCFTHNETSLEILDTPINNQFPRISRALSCNFNNGNWITWLFNLSIYDRVAIKGYFRVQMLTYTVLDLIPPLPTSLSNVQGLIQNSYMGLVGEKTCLRGFQQSETQTGLLSYRN